jgi:hypothetical protein
VAIALQRLICRPDRRGSKRKLKGPLRPVSKLLSALLLVSGLVAPAFAQPRGADDSVMVFGGVASETNFTDLLLSPWNAEVNPIGVFGASYSRRLGTVNELAGDIGLGHVGDDFTIEAEGGVSARFGDENLGEAWAALYLRFDGLPWNDTVYTTIGANTGVSLLTDLSDFEAWRDSNGKSSILLHYLAPEFTFADPENKDLELVLRLHHRSGVFGLFDGVVSGSTFLSAGIRVRF